MATHLTDFRGSIKLSDTPPASPVIGDEYWDTSQKSWMRWSGNNWLGTGAFTTTSTSTTTTTSTSTSTSTTTTSTSSSTTTTTSTSTTTTG